MVVMYESILRNTFFIIYLIIFPLQKIKKILEKYILFYFYIPHKRIFFMVIDFFTVHYIRLKLKCVFTRNIYDRVKSYKFIK